MNPQNEYETEAGRAHQRRVANIFGFCPDCAADVMGGQACDAGCELQLRAAPAVCDCGQPAREHGLCAACLVEAHNEAPAGDPGSHEIGGGR